jgi:uncharacterized LabA/DUF88 family protein
MRAEQQLRIAVLIDAENVSNKYIKLIMDEISDYGIATYKRLYGDFTIPSAQAWLEITKEYAITPVFQSNYTHGKNASDFALTIDAMDILYSDKVEGFCIVTSDSDFTKLAIRLREAGMAVIGMGEQKTPNSLVSACETFKFLDLLYKENEPAKEEKKSPIKKKNNNNQTIEVIPNTIPSREQIEEEIISIIKLKNEEWVNLAEVGTNLPKRVPGFDPRNYGCTKLKELVEGFNSFTLRVESNPNSKILKIVYVSIKN